MRKILVIAPHPDDETIGCGGTLLKHKANGAKLYWLIMTCMSEEQGWVIDKIKNRKLEIKKVSNIYGFEKIIELNYPTMTLDQIPMEHLVKNIAECFNDIQPEIVYLPNSTDIHTDHQITFQAGYSCTKSFRFPFVKKVLSYETLSETEYAANLSHKPFVPNVFIDITGTIEQKIEIMKIYKDELKPHPFPRSIENIKALATIRGAISNCMYAEGFSLVRYCE